MLVPGCDGAGCDGAGWDGLDGAVGCAVLPEEFVAVPGVVVGVFVAGVDVDVPAVPLSLRSPPPPPQATRLATMATAESLRQSGKVMGIPIV